MDFVGIVVLLLVVEVELGDGGVVGVIVAGGVVVVVVDFLRFDSVRFKCRSDG